MNKFIILTITFCNILIVTACGETQNKQSVEVNTAQEVEIEKQKTADVADVSFKDGMTGKVFHNYLQLKMALVNTDFIGAKTAAGNLSEAFTSEREELKSMAIAMAESENIDEQREIFSTFTNAVFPLVEENLMEGKIYKKFCPMALNDGAYWLSDIKEINNPYYGDKMLRCGRVDQEISK